MSFIKRSNQPVINKPVGVIRIQNDQSQFRADMAIANAVNNAGKSLTDYLVKEQNQKQTDIARNYVPEPEIIYNKDTGEVEKITADSLPTFTNYFGQERELKGQAAEFARRRLFRAVASQYETAYAEIYTNWENSLEGVDKLKEKLENYQQGVTQGLVNQDNPDLVANLTIAGTELIAKTLAKGGALRNTQDRQVTLSNLVDFTGKTTTNLSVQGDIDSALSEVKQFGIEAAVYGATQRFISEETDRNHRVIYLTTIGRVAETTRFPSQLLEQISISLKTGQYTEEKIDEMVTEYGTAQAREPLRQELNRLLKLSKAVSYNSINADSAVTKLAGQYAKGSANVALQHLTDLTKNSVQHLGASNGSKVFTNNYFAEASRLASSENPSEQEAGNNMLANLQNATHVSTDFGAELQSLLVRAETEPNVNAALGGYLKLFENANGVLVNKNGVPESAFKKLELLKYTGISGLSPQTLLQNYTESNNKAQIIELLDLKPGASNSDIKNAIGDRLDNIFGSNNNITDLPLLANLYDVLLSGVRNIDLADDIMMGIEANMTKDPAMGDGRSLYGPSHYFPKNSPELETLMIALSGKILGKVPALQNIYKDWESNPINLFTKEGGLALERVQNFNPNAPQYVVIDRELGSVINVGEDSQFDLYAQLQIGEDTATRVQGNIQHIPNIRQSNQLYDELRKEMMADKTVPRTMKFNFGRFDKELLEQLQPYWISQKRPYSFLRQLELHLEGK